MEPPLYELFIRNKCQKLEKRIIIKKMKTLRNLKYHIYNKLSPIGPREVLESRF